MPKPYPIEAAANTILARCESRRLKVDPMKLQKLVYMAHGYYSGKYGKPLVDEAFEAWPYGPVATSLYHEFKHFGSAEIAKGTRAQRTFVSYQDEENIDVDIEESEIDENDSKAIQVIDYVLDTYGKKTGIYLSDLTHKVGSPWDETRRQNPNMRNVSIDNALIRNYFKGLVSSEG